MATLSYQAQSGTWSGTFNLNYSAVYDRAKNQTTITFENCTAVYSSAVGWASTTETTITVKNEAGTKKTVTLNTELKNTDAGGGTKTFIATPNPASVILDHSAGVGKKTAELSSHTLFTLRPYSDSSLMHVGGDSETVTITSAELFTMTKSTGTGYVITVDNSTTGKTGLASGALVAAGDKLKISFAANTGYELKTHTVNGSSFTSGGSHTVSGNVSVTATAALKSYTLTINADAHALVTVKRGTETLASGATVSHFDVLTISFSALTGYEVKSAVLNGVEITSPYTHEVTGSVNINIVTSLLSSTWICTNGVFKRYFINIYIQGAWRRYREKIFPGGGTEQQAICGQALCGTIKCGGDI